MPQEQNIRIRYASPSISNLAFYIPFAYLYQVRLGTVPKLLSWMLLYLMPTAYFSGIITDSTCFCFVTDYLLILTAVFTIYESGYIYNDAVAVKYESSPSIRLYPQNQTFIEQHYKSVISSRAVLSLLCLSVLLFIHHAQIQWIYTALSIVIIIPLFMLYNYFRDDKAVWLYPFLVLSRYMPFMIPYSVFDNLTATIMLIISFPLLNAIERFSMPRHRFAIVRHFIPTENSKTVFRVAYYLTVALILTPLVNIKMMIPVYVLGLYRIFIWLLTLFYTPKNYLQG